MNLKPLSDHLIVTPIRKEEYTKAGLVLPDTHEKERPEQGEVIAVGPGKMLDNGQRAALDIQVGQKVLFKKYAPDDFKGDGKEYLVLSESDIIAIVD